MEICSEHSVAATPGDILCRTAQRRYLARCATSKSTGQFYYASLSSSIASCEGGNKELKCGGLLSLPPRSINHENEQGYKLRPPLQCTRAEAAARASSGDRNSRDVRRGLSVVAR